MKILVKKVISSWKTEIISSVIIALCLFLVYLFPIQGNLQNFSRSLFFLLILPILYIRFILKKQLPDFGFNLQDRKTGFSWMLGMLLVSFLIIFILIRLYDFDKNYLVPAYIATSFWIFLFYELILVNVLLFINEFFFKGFFLQSFTQKLGPWSVLIQMLAYLLFIISLGNFTWQLAPMIILSVTGGIVAYKSRSFVYSYLMSIIFLILLDTYIIHIFK